MAKWIEEADRKTSCSRCKARIEVGQRFYYARRGTYYCELCGSVAEHDEPEVGAIESGVLKDLDTMPEEAAEGTIAQLALHNARKIDNGDVADRDIAPLYKELRQMIIQLKDQYPPEPEDDDTTKKRKARERRLLMGGELHE